MKSWRGAYAGLDFDQMDRLYFPNKGWSSRLACFKNPTEGYSKVVAELIGAHSFGDYVADAKLSDQGSAHGVVPAYDAGMLGGLNNLSGFAQNQLNGDDIRYAGLRDDMRAGVSIETGKVGKPYSETQLTGWMNIEFGIDLPRRRNAARAWLSGLRPFRYRGVECLPFSWNAVTG
jgi:NTE family protein